MRKIKIILAFLLSVFALASVFAANSSSSVFNENDGKCIKILLEKPSLHDFAESLNEDKEWNFEWKCNMSGDGAIEQLSHSEYITALEEAYRQEDPDTFVFEPEVVGAAVEYFYFRGIRPGAVDLRIVCESPDSPSPYVEATYRITVSSDLKLEAVETSEKYDWGDLKKEREK